MGVVAEWLAARPNMVLTEATITIYFERLGKYSLADLKAASKIGLDENDYFPSIHQWHQYVKSLPPPRMKLLDEPRPTPEQIAKQPSLEKMVKDLAKRKAI